MQLLSARICVNMARSEWRGGVSRPADDLPRVEPRTPSPRAPDRRSPPAPADTTVKVIRERRPLASRVSTRVQDIYYAVTSDETITYMLFV